jgi:hypothetical protein
MKYNKKYDFLKYLFLFIFLLTLLYTMYNSYKNIYTIMNDKFKEGFIHHTQVVCDNNDDNENCQKGCNRPTEVSNKCPNVLFKKDGKCFRKCPYECSNPLDKCKMDVCCMSCGHVDIEVPCVENENDIPSESNSISSVTNSSIKSKTLDNNMVDVEQTHNYLDNLPPYVSKWPCQYNITGTFTECGPIPANSVIRM